MDTSDGIQDQLTSQFSELKELLVKETTSINKNFENWSKRVEGDLDTHKRCILQNQAEVRDTKKAVVQQALRLGQVERRNRDLTRRKYKE